MSQGPGLNPALGIPPAGWNTGNPGTARAASPDGNFGAVLQDRLIFSQHAQTRMQSRQIQLTREDAKQLSQAMDEAGRKGSKQAAVILGPDIYIVAPPSRTVITSIHPPAEGMKVISQVDTVVYVSRTSHALGGTLGLSSVHPGEEASGSRSTEGTPAASHWSLISSLEESSGEEGEV